MIISMHKHTGEHIMAKFRVNTNSLTIAHYILLFLVTGVCIAIVAWIMISRHNATPTNNISKNITHISGNTPCVKRTIETVNKLWEYNPRAVPTKYWDIAMNYMNQPITTTTYGICEDVAYVCHPGQTMRECNPCAVPNARTYAQSMHITDSIQSNCNSGN